MSPCPSSRFSAGCLETFMKHDSAMGNLLIKRQGDENLLRNSLIIQFRIIPKTEPLVIVRVAHKDTLLPARFLQ